ncbi:properdin-like isoform X2 [Crassostrea virginica]
MIVMWMNFKSILIYFISCRMCIKDFQIDAYPISCSPDEHLVNSPSGYPPYGICKPCEGTRDSSTGPWSQCSVTCGDGSRSRVTMYTSSCGSIIRQTTETTPCHQPTCSVNGAWSSWGQFTPCDKSCGEGIQVRFRTCTNPSPSAAGGQPCIGDSLQTASCNTQLCPLNGAWSSWGQFTPCDKSCGEGIQVRFRTCTNPSPSTGGQPCNGDSLQTASCNTQLCPKLVTLTNPTASALRTLPPDPASESPKQHKRHFLPSHLKTNKE